VVGDPDAMTKLEAIVHPLVAKARDRFLEAARAAGAPVVLLDIPLLFETGGDQLVDAVVVVSAAPEIQRQRVMERPGMTAEKFEALLAKQMPDAEKRWRADFIVDSGHGIESARAQVREILAKVAKLAPVIRT
jgi:dephospho-CoA kinase